MKNNQLKIGSALSYLQMGLNIIIGLLYTPIMIRLLGQSEYGLYNTVSSTISMLSILSLGFNSSYVRYFSIYKNKKNEDAIYKLNGLFLLIFTVIGCIALISGAFLTLNLDLVFSDGLTAEEYEIARILMSLLTINLAISFPMSVFTSIISANERFVFLKLIGMVNTVFSPLITLPLLLMGHRSIMMVSVSVSVSCVTYLIYLYYVLAVLKNKFIFHDFEKGLFKNLFVYTFFLAVNLIVDQINWNIDKILLGRYRGTTAVAVYSVGYSLYAYYSLFSTSVSGVFTTRIHDIVNSTKESLVEQRRRITELFTKVGRIQFLILGLILSGIVFWGDEFIVKIWAGEEYYTSYYVALLLIVPASIALIQNLGIEVQRAQNKHHFRSVVYFIMAIINLVISIYLCQKYGAVGSAIGTAISLLLANGLLMNIYYYCRCNIDIISFWKSILQLSRGLIIPIGFAGILTYFWPIDSIIVFLIQGLSYSFVYSVSMWLYGMNDYEKYLVRSMLKKKGVPK